MKRIVVLSLVLVLCMVGVAGAKPRTLSRPRASVAVAASYTSSWEVSLAATPAGYKVKPLSLVCDAPTYSNAGITFAMPTGLKPASIVVTGGRVVSFGGGSMTVAPDGPGTLTITAQ